MIHVMERMYRTTFEGNQSSGSLPEAKPSGQYEMNWLVSFWGQYYRRCASEPV